MTTVELTHPVVVVTDDQGNYRAECGCGWSSDWYDDDDLAAELAGIDHLEVAIGPPDPVDKLLSGMLDVQEDLAAVVIWLADNWNTSLPVPYHVTPRYGQEGTIALAVQCVSVATLTEVAEVLGAAVTDDDYHRDSPTHYLHAVRSFGRVTIRAWTPAL